MMITSNLIGESKDWLRKNLRTLRIQFGYTQGHIAEILKINRSTYTYYQTGKTIPDIFTLVILSDLYDIAIEDFLSADIFSY